jgi:hypothetical protein
MTGLVEHVGAWFGLRVYRCRGCRHRFYRWGSPPAEVEILGASEAEPPEDEDAARR